MAKSIHQFIYDGATKNNRAQFINGEIFKSYYPIVQLGIQSIPFTSVFINGESMDDSNAKKIYIGNSGIYELDLQGLVNIGGLRFPEETLNLIDRAKGKLIVDIMYEKAVSE